MEDLSTYQHAEIICESITNGQRKQARKQFANAISNYCNAHALLNDVCNIIGSYFPITPDLPQSQITPELITPVHVAGKKGVYKLILGDDE